MNFGEPVSVILVIYVNKFFLKKIITEVFIWLTGYSNPLFVFVYRALDISSETDQYHRNLIKSFSFTSCSDMKRKQKGN